jgi:ABC-2 type transport system ATP-binding protein
MSILAFNSVTKTYRRHFWEPTVAAVRDLSFTIEKNGIFGFVGPNGAGKTTSIKMLLGLVRPSRGSVTIRGKSAIETAARRGVAFVSEQPYLYAYLTAAESLEFAWRLNRRPAAGMHKAIDVALERVGLTDQGHKKVHEFSKGMQQRLSMAQALLAEAALFIFDEPMSGLDPMGRRLFRTLLRELANEGGCIFFSTHILEDIETLCDHVIALSSGKLVYDGAISELLAQGYIGTEIVVASLTDAQQVDLAARGHSVSNLPTGAFMITVSSRAESGICLRWLYEREIVPLSVTPATRPIETILYGNKEPEAA